MSVNREKFDKEYRTKRRNATIYLRKKKKLYNFIHRAHFHHWITVNMYVVKN